MGIELRKIDRIRLHQQLKRWQNKQESPPADCKRHTACSVSCLWRVLSGERDGGTPDLRPDWVPPPPGKNLAPETEVSPPSSP